MMAVLGVCFLLLILFFFSGVHGGAKIRASPPQVFGRGTDRPVEPVTPAPAAFCCWALTSGLLVGTVQPVGFVTFCSRADAEAAMEDLQVGRRPAVTRNTDSTLCSTSLLKKVVVYTHHRLTGAEFWRVFSLCECVRVRACVRACVRARVCVITQTLRVDIRKIWE